MADITVRLSDMLEMLTSQPENVDNFKLAYENIDTNITSDNPLNIDKPISDTISISVVGQVQSDDDSIITSEDVYFSPNISSYKDPNIHASGTIVNISASGFIDHLTQNAQFGTTINLCDDSNDAPIWNLISPSNLEYERRENIIFTIEVFIDGDSVSNGISWYSSIDGKIGDGATIEYRRLSIGNHKIFVVVDGYPSYYSFYLNVVMNEFPSKPLEIGEI